jgi:hypothetical protein
MSRRAVAWSLWAVALVLLPAGPILFAVESAAASAIPSAVGLLCVQLTASSVGVIIARRLPENAVGWIFLALGAGLGLALGTAVWSQVGLETDTGPLPGDDAAAWLSSWLLVPLVSGLPMLLLLLFPDGRFVSRRWRRVGLTIAGLVTVVSVLTALQPGRIEPGLQNPMAPGGAVGDVIEVLNVIATVLALPAFALAVAGLVVRFRRSRGIERQQLKWFTYVAAIAAVGLLVGIVSSGPLSDVGFAAGLLGLAGLPVAAGIAIMRYRLYDIDVVINRTLVYAALTATLAATYVGLVLLLQLLLSPGSDLAIAGSTLAVAALFGPARARIQAGVDRRFYRRKYDATRTVEVFGARLRDQVDLAALGGELRGVVAETMQPAHVSLWLREVR